MEQDICGDIKIQGGKYEWKCTNPPHEDNKPDRHFYEPFEIEPKQK